MNGKIFWVCGLLMMLILSSFTVAAGNAQRYYGFITLEQLDKNNPNEITVGILISEQAVTPTREDAKKVYDQIKEDCKDADDINACFLQKADELNADPAMLPTFSSIEGARFNFMYYSTTAGEWVDVPGCSGENAVRALEMKELQYYNHSVNYYYGTCTVPKEIYRGRRVDVKVFLLSDPLGRSIDATPQTVRLSDVTISPSDVFASVVYDIIGTFVSGGTAVGEVPYTCPEGQVCPPQTTLPCIGIFLIVGLLLASLYFAGKSPITLLDITTPRLPSPKGFVASGQVMLPYGYGEMKRGIKGKIGKGLAAASFTAKKLSDSMGHSSTLDRARQDIRNQKLRSIDMTADVGGAKQGKQLQEILATAGAATGMKYADMAHLFKKLPYYYGDAEHRTVAEIMNRLQKQGGEKALLAATIKDQFLSLRTYQTMEVLSGHPDLRKRGLVHQKAQNVVGKLAGLNRYIIGTGTMMAGGYDSIVRSAGVAKRGTVEMFRQAPTMARGVAKTTIELIGGRRALERMEKGKAAKVAAWVKKPPATMEIGQMFPVHEHMGHLYKTLNKEVMKDELTHVMKQLYKALGVDFAKLRINEEELARMGYTPSLANLLERSGLNTAKYRAVEKEMIAILANKEYSDMQKLNLLMALAKKHGAVIDPDGTMMQLNERLAKIAASEEPEYMKYLALQEELERHSRTVKAAGAGEIVTDDHFYTVVGRNSVNGSDIWDKMVFRTMLYDIEEGHLAAGAGLKEEAISALLNIRNRVATLCPTSNIEELIDSMRNLERARMVEKENLTIIGMLLKRRCLQKKERARQRQRSQTIQKKEKAFFTV